MIRPSIAFVALLISLRLLPAAEPAAWEVWDDCRLKPDQFFDGDSFHIQHGRKSAIVRLYFVDAPETDAGYAARVAEQTAYFRTNKAALERGAIAAKDFTAKFLERPFRVITRRQVAPGASRKARYYGIVERHGQRLDAALVTAGLARVGSEPAAYPDAATGQQVFQRLRVLEQEAAQARRGLWAASGPQLEPFTQVVKPRLKRGVRIDVNTATKGELETLPGIGPKTAEQLIRARPIANFEALDALPGFGPKKLAALRDLVSF